MTERRARTQIPGQAWRMGEHIRGLRFPGTRDGREGRYTMLRRSFSSIGMLPVAVCNSVDNSLALEATLIAVYQPRGNTADQVQARLQKALGQVIPPHRARTRLRPLPRFRKPVSTTRSGWMQPVFRDALAKRVTERERLAAPPRGAVDLHGTFNDLYRQYQREELLDTGHRSCWASSVVGPQHGELVAHLRPEAGSRGAVPVAVDA